MIVPAPAIALWDHDEGDLVERAPTVEDVAERAGVSRQTVSNVLNNPEIVREPTRERVLAAIKELGYRRHAAARSLRTRRSSSIGVHLDPYAGGVSGVVLDRFIHALTEQAGERGMRVLVYAARSPEEETARLGELIDGAEIDAVVLTGTFRGDDRTRWLLERGLPFVAFGRSWNDPATEPPHLWVDVDGAAGTRQATEHALTIGDHVAFLGWPAGSGTGDDRERGWRETLEGRGLSGPRWVSEENVTAARETVRAHLAAEMPDAIVCASDSLAIGAALAAADRGVRELPIIGFDNTPSTEALGISSVEQKPEAVAAAVLKMLMGGSGRTVSALDVTDPQGRVLVEPELIVRHR